MWHNDEKPAKNVRYIPIQVEAGHPSTSTPYVGSRIGNRMQSVPVKQVDSSNRIHWPSTPSGKARFQPVRQVVHQVIEDDSEDNDEEVWFFICSLGGLTLV